MTVIGKRTIVSILLLILCLGVEAQFKVVIDAGHGGKDPGACGRKLREKDINLDVALELGRLIQANHFDTKVIYTRSTDVFVELQQRANIANKAKANLFISIHTNASTNKSAYGTETYTLGLRRSNDNFEVAKRENEVILLEEGYKEKYEGFDPRSAESYIMFDVMQNKYMAASIDMAQYVQDGFQHRVNRKNNGVRQDVFLVLRNTGMPSILVELGFISNPAEEAFLSSVENRKKLAHSIYLSFQKFKDDFENRERRTQGGADKPATTKKSDKTVTPEPVPVTPAPSAPAVAAAADEVTPSPKATAGKVSEFYSVQFLVSPRELSDGSSLFKGIVPTGMYVHSGYYKYYVGEYATKEATAKELKRVSKVFKDAFIIRLKDGKRD